MAAWDWDKRARYLEEHTSMLAEKRTQDLSVLTTYARKSQETLEEITKIRAANGLCTGTSQNGHTKELLFSRIHHLPDPK